MKLSSTVVLAPPFDRNIRVALSLVRHCRPPCTLNVLTNIVTSKVVNLATLCIPWSGILMERRKMSYTFECISNILSMIWICIGKAK